MKLRGNRCQCSECGEYFGSVNGFDRHRTGKYEMTPPNYGRRCLTPEEMTAKKMRQNERGFWVSGNMPARLLGFARETISGETAT